MHSAPLEIERGLLHVPFDEISGHRDCEYPLADAVRRGDRVALVGPSGAGKSSVTQHVMDGLGEDVAALRVRVGLESSAVSTEPAAFVEHLLHTVATFVDVAGDDSARRMLRRTGDEAARSRRSVAVEAGAGTPWLTGKLRVELGSVLGEKRRSGGETLEHAQLVLDLIRASGVQPLLVLDDTDHWVQGHSSAETEARMTVSSIVSFAQSRSSSTPA